MRECGSCSLCCKLLPMSAKGNTRAGPMAVDLELAGMVPKGVTIAPDFDKPAGARCPHQSYKKGCKIYLTRPLGCRIWHCRWLLNDDTNDLPRPDRSHYVIDIAPDFVKNDRLTVPVVQIWCDADYPDAHRDPRLRAYIERRGKDGYATLIRFNNDRARLICPPQLASDGQWHEVESMTTEHEHTAEEKVRELGATVVVVE